MGFAFLAYTWSKKKKRKIRGRGKDMSLGKHYLDNYPGDNASNRDIIESHLESDLRACKYRIEKK